MLNNNFKYAIVSYKISTSSSFLQPMIIKKGVNRSWNANGWDYYTNASYDASTNSIKAGGINMVAISIIYFN